MKIIDISWPISEQMTTYKNKKVVEFRALAQFEKDNVRETLLTLSTHVGTHIDAPSHFLRSGKTIDQISLEKYIGKCRVLDLTAVSDKITKSDLEMFNIVENEIILLKTTNSFHNACDEFDYNFVYLDHSGAEFLASKKIKAVGIDYLGIERNQPNHETHTILFEAEIPIIEGLKLGEAAGGKYQFICLPLNLQNLEAAQARAILIEE